MKYVYLIIAIMVTIIFTQCTSSASKQTKQNDSCCAHEQTTENIIINNDTTTSVYYFHASRRCATCEAVESVTKKFIEQQFAEHVTFQSINREKNPELVEKFKVNGQTLLICKGNEVINLTNVAFLNARSKPEVLKTKLKEAINSLK